MTTLTVPTTTDYSAQVLNNVGLINFTNAVILAKATFDAAQFDNIAILDTVLIDGTNATNKIVVNNGSVDASRWQFSNWGIGGDTITLNGSAADDSVTGSGKADIITGGSGTDTLKGGRGDDEFVYDATTDAEPGETVNGGSGAHDQIVLNAGLDSNFDGPEFDAGAVLGIEALVFRDDGYGIFHEDIFGPGGITEITGSSGSDRVSVTATAVDFSSVNFLNWTPLENSTQGDYVLIYGNNMGNTLTGSSTKDSIYGMSGDDALDGGDGNDFFMPGQGADTISGGSGDDNIAYFLASELEAGEVLDGGSGVADKLTLYSQVADENYDLRAISLHGIEALVLDDAYESGRIVVAQLSAPQLSAGTIAHVTIDTSVALAVEGGAIDLSAVTFDGTAAADASLTLLGIAGADTLIGGSLHDTLFGGSSLDVMVGGLGDDVFRYDLASDIEAGEFADGSDGADSINLSLSFAGLADFTSMVTASIERLVFLAGGQRAKFTTEQAAELTEVQGGAGKQTLRVVADSIDLSALTFTGWKGSDIVKLTGTAAADSITGSSERDIILGLDGEDIVDAGAGDDDITGGLGREEMSGDEGADSFIYESLDDTPTGTSRDRIQDFTQGEDVIVIEVPGFTFIEDDAFSASGVAEINYEVGTNATTINLDGDGDGVAEAKIVLTGLFTMTSADFVLL